jgi:hypothetical protein
MMNHKFLLTLILLAVFCFLVGLETATGAARGFWGIG